MSHWRFGVLWHLSREFYRDDNNKANKGVRTLDKYDITVVTIIEWN